MATIFHQDEKYLACELNCGLFIVQHLNDDHGIALDYHDENHIDWIFSLKDSIDENESRALCKAILESQTNKGV